MAHGGRALRMYFVGTCWDPGHIETDNQMSEILIKLGFLLVERFG